MHLRQTATLFTVLMITTSLAGCMEGAGESPTKVYVKDAPTDEFENVYITFTKVAVHEAGDDDDETEEAEGSEGDEPETDDAGWHTLFEGSEEIDLLAFSEPDEKALLGEEGLENGTYNQIVVTVESARGITTDGDEVDIDVITGWVRIVRAFEVDAGNETEIVIDLDLDRSLVEQGPRGWALKPVVGSVTVNGS